MTNFTAAGLAEAGQLAEPGPGDVVSRDGTSTLRRLAERGMISAEWAVGLIAAIAIAGVLIVVLTNGVVEKTLLEAIVGILKSIVGKL